MPGLIVDALGRVWSDEANHAAREGTVASPYALLPRASDSQRHPVTTSLTSTCDASTRCGLRRGPGGQRWRDGPAPASTS
jgi:hypothetical protein